MSLPRLLWVNAFIRVAAAGSGQLFAYLLAERVGARIGSGAMWVGVIGGAFFFTEIVGAPLAGRVADKVGQRSVMRWGPLFGVASALVAVFAALGPIGGAALEATGRALPGMGITAVGLPELWLLGSVLFLARLAEGASAAATVPTTLVLLARGTEGDVERRARMMGAFEATSLVGMIAGYVLVGVGWAALGAWAFLALPPLYAAAWLLIPGGSEPGVYDAAAPYEEPARPRPSGVRETLGKLAARPGAVGFGVAWLAVNAVAGLWIQQAPFLLSLPERSADQALVGGFSGTEVAAVFAVWGAALLVGIGVWSTLAAAWPRRRLMTWALAGMMGVTLCLTLVNHGASPLFLFLAVALVAVEAAFAPAAFAHLADLSEPLDESRGLVLGLYALALAGGQLLGNVLGAPFAAWWRMDGVLALTAILAVVAWVGVRGVVDGSHDVDRS